MENFEIDITRGICHNLYIMLDERYNYESSRPELMTVTRSVNQYIRDRFPSNYCSQYSGYPIVISGKSASSLYWSSLRTLSLWDQSTDYGALRMQIWDSIIDNWDDFENNYLLASNQHNE